MSTQSTVTTKLVGDAPPWDVELQLWLETYVKDHPHINLKKLSSSEFIGQHGYINESTLRLYMEGRYYLAKEKGGFGTQYKSDNNIERILREFRARIDSQLYLGHGKEFIETKTWRQVQHACTVAIKENEIVVVWGKYGIGKTRSIREFADRNLQRQPMYILCSALVTPRSLLKRLATEFRIQGTGGKSMDELLDLIAKRLQRQPRAIFIDQANYLDRKGLGILCHLWEVAKTPILICGTQTLFDNFHADGRTVSDELGQLASRVRVFIPLAELSLKETVSIVKRYLPDFDEAYVEHVYDVTRHNHRHLDKGMPDLIAIWNHERERVRSGEVKIEDIVGRAFARLAMG